MCKCEVCGDEITSIANKTGGRPRTYCSENCSNYSKYKNALEKAILNLELPRDKISIIRGDMFRLANLLSNSTKTNGVDNNG